MAKRLLKEEKILMVKCFTEGMTTDQLADKFACTKSTISRNLKNTLGDEIFKELIEKSKSGIEVFDKNKLINKDLNKNFYQGQNISDNNEEEYLSTSSFIEITPLDYQIENSPQKDLSSVPISDINFPKIVYMIVDKKIELETKYLKEYPDWQFLSKDELNRKTIEIYDDLQKAKRVCNKEQKVIKIPNTAVFKIVSPLLISRGITRIVNADKLIAL